MKYTNEDISRMMILAGDLNVAFAKIKPLINETVGLSVQLREVEDMLLKGDPEIGTKAYIFSVENREVIAREIDVVNKLLEAGKAIDVVKVYIEKALQNSVQHKMQQYVEATMTNSPPPPEPKDKRKSSILNFHRKKDNDLN